ncbi:MAG: hypothetical protein UZ21_OP11001000532 [Microgenomates bacterium OLB22]|nr:MAG: hypothetical protein UZ21_OP11001000532 [Microgenomates bacterium OLB22]
MLITVGIAVSILALWLVLSKGTIRIPFFGKAQEVEAIRVIVEASNAESSTIVVSVESKAYSPGFIKLVGNFDPTQMQIRKVENKSQLIKSGYTANMIYSTPNKEANLTGRYVFAVGAKPGMAIEGRLRDEIAAITLQGNSSTRLGRQQVQEFNLKIDTKQSQIIALDGTILPFVVDYRSSQSQSTRSDTRR